MAYISILNATDISTSAAERWGASEVHGWSEPYGSYEARPADPALAREREQRRLESYNTRPTGTEPVPLGKGCGE